jgi:hypothetical protein
MTTSPFLPDHRQSELRWVGPMKFIPDGPIRFSAGVEGKAGIFSAKFSVSLRIGIMPFGPPF